MNLRVNNKVENNFKLNLADNDFVEFEGQKVTKKLAEMATSFINEHKDSIVDKPPIPTLDSKGNSINSDGKQSFVKIIISVDQLPTIMASKDNSASKAFLYSSSESRWKSKPSMWQDYVYNGSLGIDYFYIDDIEAKNIIKSYKKAGI